MKIFKGRKKSFYVCITLCTLCILCNIAAHFLDGTMETVLSIIANISVISSCVVALFFGT